MVLRESTGLRAKARSGVVDLIITSGRKLMCLQWHCKKAKLQARIKLTALCSVIDKENSIEFLLDFLHYLYNYYMVYALFSHTYHVTHHVMSCDCDYP